MVRQQNIVYKILNYLINNQLNSLNYKKKSCFIFLYDMRCCYFAKKLHANCIICYY